MTKQSLCALIGAGYWVALEEVVVREHALSASDGRDLHPRSSDESVTDIAQHIFF